MGLNERAQLDGAGYVIAVSLMVIYIIGLILAAEIGLQTPAWLPSWIGFVPPVLLVLWWVPVVILIAISGTLAWIVDKKPFFPPFGGAE